MKRNPIKDQSYTFALNIVSFCRSLQEGREYVLSKQLLKSGTSIGANVEEGLQAQSKSDFISKMSISLKEAHESDYWLRLINDSGLDSSKQTARLRQQLHSVICLLTAIIRTSKQNKALFQ